MSTRRTKSRSGSKTKKTKDSKPPKGFVSGRIGLYNKKNRSVMTRHLTPMPGLTSIPDLAENNTRTKNRDPKPSTHPPTRRRVKETVRERKTSVQNGGFVGRRGRARRSSSRSTSKVKSKIQPSPRKSSVTSKGKSKIQPSPRKSSVTSKGKSKVDPSTVKRFFELVENVNEGVNIEVKNLQDKKSKVENIIFNLEKELKDPERSIKIKIAKITKILLDISIDILKFKTVKKLEKINILKKLLENINTIYSSNVINDQQLDQAKILDEDIYNIYLEIKPDLSKLNILEIENIPNSFKLFELSRSISNNLQKTQDFKEKGIVLDRYLDKLNIYEKMLEPRRELLNTLKVAVIYGLQHLNEYNKKDFDTVLSIYTNIKILKRKNSQMKGINDTDDYHGKDHDNLYELTLKEIENFEDLMVFPPDREDLNNINENIKISINAVANPLFEENDD